MKYCLECEQAVGGDLKVCPYCGACSSRLRDLIITQKYYVDDPGETLRIDDKLIKADDITRWAMYSYFDKVDVKHSGLVLEMKDQTMILIEPALFFDDGVRKQLQRFGDVYPSVPRDDRLKEHKQVIGSEIVYLTIPMKKYHPGIDLMANMEGDQLATYLEKLIYDHEGRASASVDLMTDEYLESVITKILLDMLNKRRSERSDQKKRDYQ